MIYTKDDVIQYVSEEDVKFIRLAFCDIYGNQKNISIMPSELDRAFENGILIDISAITGFESCKNKKLFLYPDPSTLVVLPWRPNHGRVVRMFCLMVNEDGTHFKFDSRRILKDAVKYSFQKGYTFTFGIEPRFYLMKTDEDGNPTNEPFDNANYMDIAPMDKGENVRREICLTLEEMGIMPQSSHHDAGPGQNKISFKFSDPLTSADNVITFFWVVKTIAARNGLYADFSPIPISGKALNKMNINMSVQGDDKALENAVVGMKNRLAEMTAFLKGSEQSYEGDIKDVDDIVYIQDFGNNEKRIEIVNTDCQINVYTVFALLIYSSIEGIENIDVDKKPFPRSLSDAKEIVKNSNFIKNKFSDICCE